VARPEIGHSTRSKVRIKLSTNRVKSSHPMSIETHQIHHTPTTTRCAWLLHLFDWLVCRINANRRHTSNKHTSCERTYNTIHQSALARAVFSTVQTSRAVGTTEWHSAHVVYWQRAIPSLQRTHRLAHVGMRLQALITYIYCSGVALANNLRRDRITLAFDCERAIGRMQMRMRVRNNKQQTTTNKHNSTRDKSSNEKVVRRRSDRKATEKPQALA
jgi:hypothetical protein